MSDTTTVYVLERGVDYEGNDVKGIFSTVELAKAAYPGVSWIERTQGAHGGATYWEAAHMPEVLSGDDLWITAFVLNAPPC